MSPNPISTTIILLLIIQTCKPNKDESTAQITSFENNIDHTGYNMSFRTSNNIERSESGTIDHTNGDEVLRVNGRYRYTSPEGNTYEVYYIADENGYRIVSQEKLVPKQRNLNTRIGGATIASLVG